MAEALDPFFAGAKSLYGVLNSLKHVKPPKVYADPDYLVEYKGCKVQYPFYLNLDQLDTFETRPTDVCVAAFPKTGTTWISAIVYMIVHDGDPQSILTGSPLKWKVPYLEMTIPYGDELSQEVKAVDYLKTQEGRRTYVTHLNATASPQKVIDEAKIVYIYRNPKDTILSMYHFMKAAIWFGFSGTLEEVVDDFINDRCMNAPYFEHIESFWKLRDRPNVFITSFEELLREPKKTIRSLAKFLDKNLTEAQIETIYYYSQFKQMKANPLTSLSELESIGIINTRIARFMRTGQVGGWKKSFNETINRKIDTWITKNLADRPELGGIKLEYELDYDLD